MKKPERYCKVYFVDPESPEKLIEVIIEGSKRGVQKRAKEALKEEGIKVGKFHLVLEFQKGI